MCCWLVVRIDQKMCSACWAYIEHAQNYLISITENYLTWSVFFSLFGKMASEITVVLFDLELVGGGGGGFGVCW